jgi:hypothetical protein
MATLVVEDGSGIANANSYTSVSFSLAHFDNRANPAAWSGAATAVQEAALRQATFYLEDVYGANWRGAKASEAQALSWPRSGVTDGDTGFGYDSDEIPTRLQEAVCELALRVVDGDTLNPDVAVGAAGVTTSAVSIGSVSISESYAGSSSTAPRFPEVHQKLRPLLAVSSAIAMRVGR